MITIVEHQSKSGKLKVCTRIYGSTPCNSQKGSLIYPIESLKFIGLNKNHLEFLNNLNLIEKELG
jgi:hypothetical protein